MSSSSYKPPGGRIGLSPRDVPTAFARIEAELARCAKQGEELRAPSVVLRSPGGTAFRLVVDDAGALSVVPAR